MPKTTWLILLSCCWLMVASACADAPPSLRQCDRLNLRTSQGWWLAISRDGSGEYGFGTLVARVAVGPGTFDQAKIYRESLGAWQESPLRAEDPSVAASCFAAGSSSALEYHLVGKTEWSEALLCKARRNSCRLAIPLNSSGTKRLIVSGARDRPVPSLKRPVLPATISPEFRQNLLLGHRVNSCLQLVPGAVYCRTFWGFAGMMRPCSLAPFPAQVRFFGIPL